MKVERNRAAAIAAAMISLLCLGGCDQVFEAAEEMASEQAAKMSMVFPAGKAYIVDGERVLAFGFDQCPRGQDGLHDVIGVPADAGERGCIVITPKTQQIQVMLVPESHPEKLALSNWSVKRQGKRNQAVSLLSANGTPVYDAEKISGT